MTASSTYRMMGFSMQRQRSRRVLVVATYAVLALMCLLSIVYASSMGLWIGVYASSLVSMFIFGGGGRYGLVKPFVNKPPRPEPVVLEVVGLHLNPTAARSPDESAWRNDERELGRRDLAHYRAYQPVTLLLLLTLVCAALQMHPTHWIPVPVLRGMTFSVALFATVLAATLPAAIILWTEPGVEEVGS